MLRGVGGPCWRQPGRAGPAALPRLPSVQPASCSSAPARAGPRPRDQGRAGHSSTSSPFRGGAWRTHLDVFFPGWGSRNRASWLQWPARWQLPWKAGDRGGGAGRPGGVGLGHTISSFKTDTQPSLQRGVHRAAPTKQRQTESWKLPAKAPRGSGEPLCMTGPHGGPAAPWAWSGSRACRECLPAVPMPPQSPSQPPSPQVARRTPCRAVVPARFRPWVWWGHGTLASFPPPPACSPAQGAGPSATLACPTPRTRAQCGLPGMMGEQGGWRGADVGP